MNEVPRPAWLAIESHFQLLNSARWIFDSLFWGGVTVCMQICILATNQLS
jgi:hypothetical protein